MLRTKIVHLLIGFLLCSQLLASNTGDKKVKTKVKEVTVFIEGAQLKREKN